MAADEIRIWIESLTIPTRKPRSISKVEHGIMVRLRDLTRETEINRQFQDAQIVTSYGYLRLQKEQYEEVYQTKKDQPDEVSGQFATYRKKDAGSYERFLRNIQDIEDFFVTLNGFHRIPLDDIAVEFVSSRYMKTPARYRTGQKILWINPLSRKVGKTVDGYGSLRYIVLHELGHRFLEMKPQAWNIADPELYTTPYSKKNAQTMSEEEIFAELFALSHWRSKYSQYERQIDNFIERLHT